MSTCNAPVYLSKNDLTARLVCHTKPPQPDKRDGTTKAIDIIAVHGLIAWESFAGSPFWLYDFIAKDIRGARVFTFNYDAKAVWFHGAPLKSIQDASRALLEEIAAIREEAPVARPLVFICHGFGGFIVESSLDEYRATLGLRREKVLVMAGCTHLSMANFPDRHNDNYKAIISAIKKIRKSASEDMVPVSTVHPSQSGLPNNDLEIQNPWVSEASQATTIHAVQNSPILGRQNINLQNTIAATTNSPMENTPFSPMPVDSSNTRDFGHGTSPNNMGMSKQSTTILAIVRRV
ncbi:hypothetical protein PENSUB_6806 [Penicillium subrubescens]|uniref:Protein SERAC1 n=1 Tax=Penicillium subrubescens TaxID=1316194 RepID=A0A1Q5TU97_9EURO|nr:hypothetical protein PENSUB_6806 [Penicillium subrubescens]